MFLLLTTSLCGTADAIAYCCSQKNIPFFRFNADLYNYYDFMWTMDKFVIKDPTGRSVSSDELCAVAIYKAYLPRDDYGAFEAFAPGEEKWLKCTVNYIFRALSVWAMERKLLRLFVPSEFNFEKTKQMKIAQKYFSVPRFAIFWGGTKPEKSNVIAKVLHQEKFSDGQFAYAKVVDTDSLDPLYPWFTQEIATGDRDATILYIDGKIHCFQFARRREGMTDWRVTQGTDQNQWLPWRPENGFLKKVDLYMKDMGLKFGRLDFIIGGKEPEFLEVNPCGQFGWLDDENLTLHNEVVDAILDPRTTITL